MSQGRYDSISNGFFSVPFQEMVISGEGLTFGSIDGGCVQAVTKKGEERINAANGGFKPNDSKNQ